MKKKPSPVQEDIKEKEEEAKLTKQKETLDESAELAFLSKVVKKDYVEQFNWVYKDRGNDEEEVYKEVTDI